MKSNERFANDLVNLQSDMVKLDKEIEEKETYLHNLLDKQCNLLEKQHELQQRVLAAQTENLSYQKNRENLSLRNGAVKEKFNCLNDDLKHKADSVIETVKMMQKSFGIKLQVNPTHDDFWEVKINFLENSNFNLNFHFYPSVQRFDLIKMNPEPSNIDKIKKYLFESNDISGFVCYARKFFMESTK